MATPPSALKASHTGLRCGNPGNGCGHDGDRGDLTGAGCYALSPRKWLWPTVVGPQAAMSAQSGPSAPDWQSGKKW